MWRVKEWVPGRWLVVDERGIPVYSQDPEARRQGRDKPQVFDDPDWALAVADAMNENEAILAVDVVQRPSDQQET